MTPHSPTESLGPSGHGLGPLKLHERKPSFLKLCLLEFAFVVVTLAVQNTGTLRVAGTPRSAVEVALTTSALVAGDTEQMSPSSRCD